MMSILRSKYWFISFFIAAFVWRLGGYKTVADVALWLFCVTVGILGLLTPIYDRLTSRKTNEHIEKLKTFVAEDIPKPPYPEYETPSHIDWYADTTGMTVVDCSHCRYPDVYQDSIKTEDDELEYYRKMLLGFRAATECKFCKELRAITNHLNTYGSGEKLSS